MGDERTGLDVHIPSNTISRFGPWVVALVLGASSGGGLSTFLDVTGAKAYKDAVAESIAEADALRERVVALEAQQDILVGIVNTCMLEPE